MPMQVMHSHTTRNQAEARGTGPFKLKNKLDEDLYQNKPNDHLWLLGSAAKQTNKMLYLPNPASKDKYFLTCENQQQICFRPGQWIKNSIIRKIRVIIKI